MKFPKSIYLILCYVFCELFFLHGIGATISLYYVEVLMFKKSTAIILFHTYKMTLFFSSLMGGVMADSKVGKFRTIFYCSSASIIGGLLLTIGSITTLNLPIRAFSVTGLFFIAVGTGGIRPCISTFGGEQFKLPEERALVSAFFAIYYSVMDIGKTTTTFVIPILRKDITCFGNDTCYPLAYLTLTILRILSLVIFISAKSLYKIKLSEHNVSLEFIKCVYHAIVGKIGSREKKKHWLDHAEDRYDKHTIRDVKIVFNIWKVLLPIPVFYALHDQLGSSWVFQGTHMKGDVFGYQIKPDQMQLVNPISLVILVPIFQFYVYPIIGKYLYINTQLKKITVGGIVAGIAFIASGILEINLEPTYNIQPSNGLAQIRIFNTLDCNASININDQTFILKGLDVYQNISIPVKKTTSLGFSAKFNDCHYIDHDPSLSISGNLNIQENKATSWVLTKEGLSPAFTDYIRKSKLGNPFVRTLIYVDTDLTNGTALKLNGPKMDYSISLKKEVNFTNFIEVDSGHYKLSFNGTVIAENMSIKYGGVYTIVGYISENIKVMRIVTLVNPNSIHLFCQLPQYILITIGEIMLQNVLGEFVFSEAPLYMKSLSYAGLLFTIASGNLMVIIIAKAQFFQRQVFEYFLYAVLMFIDIFIFAILAKSYKYVEMSSDESLHETLQKRTK